MKSMLVTLTLITTSYTQAAIPVVDSNDSFKCQMADRSSRPYLTFVVEKASESKQASLQYIYSPFLGNEVLYLPQPVPGCESENVQNSVFEADKIYIECQADGDAGLLTLNHLPESSNFVGKMTFPNTGVEGFDDTSIPLYCSNVEI